MIEMVMYVNEVMYDLKNLRTRYWPFQKFERLMCEVEFWEVFLMECARVFKVVPFFHLLTAE